MAVILRVIKGESVLSKCETEIVISNFTVDGKVGGGVAFTMCSDHENRPTDTTNLIVYGIDTYNQVASKEVTEPLRSAEGGDTKPKVLIVKDETDNTDRKEIL